MKVREMVSIETAIKYAVAIGFWLFSVGGTYMATKYTLNDHEKRITKIEGTSFVVKEDFENRIKSIEWRLNRGR